MRSFADPFQRRQLDRLRRAEFAVALTAGSQLIGTLPAGISLMAEPMPANLGEMPDRPGGSMSGGEQQMLTVARTLMGNPLLVLLDEPSEGVAPIVVEQMAHTIIALKREGLSILLSEQNLHFAELVSDRAYVLEKGQIRFEGSMEELAANEQVRKAYLEV